MTAWAYEAGEARLLTRLVEVRFELQLEKHDWSCHQDCSDTKRCRECGATDVRRTDVSMPSGTNKSSAVMRPGENLPPAKTNGTTWKNDALITIRAG